MFHLRQHENHPQRKGREGWIGIINRPRNLFGSISWDYTNVEDGGNIEPYTVTNTDDEDSNEPDTYTSADPEDSIEPENSTQVSRKDEKKSAGWSEVSLSEKDKDVDGHSSRRRRNTTKAPRHPQLPASHPVRAVKGRRSPFLECGSHFTPFGIIAGRQSC